MEAGRADEANEDTLIDRGVVGLVLVGAVIDAGAVVEQEVVDASGASVDRAIARVARLLALSANAVDGRLERRFTLAALRLAGGVNVEDEALLARGARLDVTDTRDAVLLASLALLLGVVVDLDVRKAGLEALGVKSVESHVVLTRCAGFNRVRASLAGRVALLASFTG